MARGSPNLYEDAQAAWNDYLRRDFAGFAFCRLRRDRTAEPVRSPPGVGGVSRGDVMGRACRPGEGWRPTTRFSPADVAGHSCHVACGSHARGATLRKMCRDSCPEALAPPNVRRVSRAAVPGSAADLLRFARRPAWCLAQICRVAGAEVVSLSRGPAWVSAHTCLVSRQIGRASCRERV